MPAYNTTKRDEVMYATIIHLAERWVPLVGQEVLKEEFAEDQLMADTENSNEIGFIYSLL